MILARLCLGTPSQTLGLVPKIGTPPRPNAVTPYGYIALYNHKCLRSVAKREGIISSTRFPGNLKIFSRGGFGMDGPQYSPLYMYVPLMIMPSSRSFHG